MKIVLRGMIGLAGAAEFAECDPLLWNRFPERFRKHFEAHLAECLRQDMSCPAGTCAVSLKEGFFQALWLLGEQCGSGLTVELERVPLDPYAVELSHEAGRNLFREPGLGYLAVRVQPEEGETVIGSLTKEPARLVKERETLRYLTRPERGY